MRRMRGSALGMTALLVILLIAGSASAGEIVIQDVIPAEGTTGTVVTITGSGFGTLPDNLSVVSMDGARSIPLQVIAAADQQIRARLGPVPPDAGPGPIVVTLGRGRPGRFEPEFEDGGRSGPGLGLEPHPAGRAQRRLGTNVRPGSIRATSSARVVLWRASFGRKDPPGGA